MKRIAFILLIMLALTGCKNYRVVDEVQIIQAMGYDVKNGNYIGTAIYPTFKQGPMTKPNILTTSSSTTYDLIPRLSSKSALPIEEGQLRLVLFGEEFAKGGITEVVHSLARNNKIGSRLQLAVAKGDAEELLRITAKKTLSDTLYLSNLVEQNIRAMNLPKMNLHLFLYNYFGKGRDPFLPYFEKKGDFVKLEGIALFKDGRFVGKVNLRDSFLVKVLLNETKNGMYQLRVADYRKKEESRVLLQNLFARSRYEWKKRGERPVLTISIHIQAAVKDYPSWLDMPQKNTLKMVREKMEKDIETSVKNLMEYFKEKEVDPLGIGDFVRSQTRNWNEEEFYREYKEIDIRPHVKVDIIQTGIGE
ncbi:Ger(x)C family spore germination protein [Thermaerobacillus caldiproteolyticus]|uniref:Ger(X)C family germination protein n=1 Tax=Thermaerobacillus caldiproteolyticus TaxID=247480 RepID=A0A7W0BZL5_9BACL|nr:Ger(x)C family spore germination protein [Anoxybacillus caldiproteolyticus]MBA2874239.1 Ger(x)C family germination protein [Anoxybacillus caldiproteolyticus]QPA31829.1 Ger(x)C family spore germination protein [Anoxybacillus caldiproteolyticus]